MSEESLSLYFTERPQLFSREGSIFKSFDLYGFIIHEKILLQKKQISYKPLSLTVLRRLSFFSTENVFLRYLLICMALESIKNF